MNDRRDKCEEERRAYECLYAAGLLEFREYQRVKIRWSYRWRDSKTLLDAIPPMRPTAVARSASPLSCPFLMKCSGSRKVSRRSSTAASARILSSLTATAFGAG